LNAETPKQKLRRLLDRLKSLTPEQIREIDKQIEELSDQDAELMVDSLADFEEMRPGTIDEFIDEINKNGIPPDD
jgi:hypothetical protein